jgi:hypothetical protein
MHTCPECGEECECPDVEDGEPCSHCDDWPDEDEGPDKDYVIE